MGEVLEALKETNTSIKRKQQFEFKLSENNHVLHDETLNDLPIRVRIAK